MRVHPFGEDVFFIQPTHHVIVVNSSRLMREFLKRTIEKFIGFQVIGEANSLQDISAAISQTSAEWLFVALPPNEDVSETLKTRLFLEHPTLRIICLWIDGSHVKMEWLDREERDLEKPTLDELENLLFQKLPGQFYRD